MRRAGLTKAHHSRIAGLVKEYKAKHDGFTIMQNGLLSIALSSSLAPFVHSIKGRLKDPEHLRKKLERKCREALHSKIPFDIDKANIFTKINDLAGVRILHLHTRQMKDIHRALSALFAEGKYNVLQAFARTWDDESRQYFESIGIETQASGENLYTSVHYVVQPNTTTALTGEIQVRTLAEELWGEVDHTINYPVRSSSLACREQIKVLARVTSSCTRLVDSIFATHAERSK
jgi:putative GTP pyrophosphokinase